MFFFARGMYGTWKPFMQRGQYATVEPADINTIPTPFVKITSSAPNRFINGDGECYIMFGIKASRADVVDELILNYFKLLSVQKG